MSKEQFEAEKDYQASIHLAKILRQKGLLTEEEYAMCSSSKNVSKRSPKRLAPWST
jgi:hypothetical protein